MTIKKAIFTSSVAAATAVMLSPAFLAGQAQGGLDPASIRKPLADTWPTYSGDYTGRRYRSLKQMEERGWVAESEERPEPSLDDERRRYYRLTDLGRRVALAELERLEGLVRAGRSKGFVPSGRPSGAGA